MTIQRQCRSLREKSAVELRSTGQPATPARETRAVWGPRPRAAVPTRVVVASARVLLALVLCCAGALAQNGASSSQDNLTQAVRELSDQVRELRSSVAEMRADSERAHAETRELRRELEDMRGASNGAKPGIVEAVVRTVTKEASTAMNVSPQDGSTYQGSTYQSSSSQTASSAEQDEQKKSSRVATLDEQYDLLSGKVDDQYQTKVESASKYRMRISGIVLLNAFSNQGVVDNIDLPELAYGRLPGNSGGSFGATARQSQLGFEVFGPELAGARTRADLQLDLAGGFPVEPNGVNSGLMRIRTATMRMDWENTSLVAGQDGLFFSPNAPTSFATLAEPALSYAGNLWSWVPQIRLEHRFTVGEGSTLLLQGGILDPVSGEPPLNGPYRGPGPGESSRQPAYGTRIAWTHDISGHPLRFGAGGYYSRQDYGFDRNVDSWAGMADLEVPLGSKFEVSGKFFRGRALGGLYGGLGQSVLFSGNEPQEPYTQLIGVNTVGGWTQLKYRATSKLEFNGAFGMDNPFARDLRYFPYAYSYGEPILARNKVGFVNFIYRPRSDLLFSAEYRRIATDSITDRDWGAGHLNLSMGVLF
jgi:hypothetical protein